MTEPDEPEGKAPPGVDLTTRPERAAPVAAEPPKVDVGVDASVDYGDYSDFAMMADPLTDRLPVRPLEPLEGPAAPKADAPSSSPPAPAVDDSGADETILIDGRSFRGTSPGERTPAPVPVLKPLSPPTEAPPAPPPPPAPAPPAEVPTAAPADPEADDPGLPVPAAAGLRGLIAALRTRRARGTQLVIALLCGLLGFFAVVQVRLQAQDNTLRTARQTDLIRILDDLNDRNDRLESEIRDLGSRRDELQFGTDRSQAALQEAEQRRAALGILAGTVPTHGPGITLRIADPGRKVDAAVLLDALQELRDAGAEAVQIGDVRVVASTDFLDAGPGRIRIDGRLVAAPYVFKVIGDPDTLDPALRIPGGVFAVLDERGATPSVDAKRTVVIDAVRPAQPPQYARPAPNSG